MESNISRTRVGSNFVIFQGVPSKNSSNKTLWISMSRRRSNRSVCSISAVVFIDDDGGWGSDSCCWWTSKARRDWRNTMSTSRWTSAVLLRARSSGNALPALSTRSLSFNLISSFCLWSLSFCEFFVCFILFSARSLSIGITRLFTAGMLRCSSWWELTMMRYNVVFFSEFLWFLCWILPDFDYLFGKFFSFCFSLVMPH